MQSRISETGGFMMEYKNTGRYYELTIASLENEEMKTRLPRRYRNSEYAKYSFLIYSPHDFHVKAGSNFNLKTNVIIVELPLFYSM